MENSNLLQPLNSFSNYGLFYKSQKLHHEESVRKENTESEGENEEINKDSNYEELRIDLSRKKVIPLSFMKIKTFSPNIENIWNYIF